jgi:putative transposase
MWKALNCQHPLDDQGQPTAIRGRRWRGARWPPDEGAGHAWRGRRDHKKPVTTVPGADHRPEDALNRDSSAPAPNTRWVADITYVPTCVGFVYVAFVLDLFSADRRLASLDLIALRPRVGRA